MPDADSQKAALTAIAALRPSAVASPSTFSLASTEAAISTLLTCSRSPSHTAHVDDDLLAIQQSPSIISFLSPFFLTSSLLLLPPASPPTSLSPSVIPHILRLWRLLRNHLRTDDHQRALFDDDAAVSSFLSALSSLSSSSDDPERSALLVTGGQLLANAMTLNAVNQQRFLSQHLLSPLFISLLASPVSAFRGSLLYVLNAILLDSARQLLFLDHPSAISVVISVVMSALPETSAAPSAPTEDEAEDEAEEECELLVHAVLRRLFLRQSAFMQLLVAQLSPPMDSAPLLLVLRALHELTADDFDTESSVPVMANCAALLSAVELHFALPLSAFAELTDDTDGYQRLPTALTISDWIHASIGLLEHILSLTLIVTTDTLPPSPLIPLLSTPSTWCLLLGLLHSPQTAFGCVSDLLSLLSLLCSVPRSEPPPFPVVTALCLLAHTHIDERQPVQREYAIVGLRALCVWERVRAELEGLKASGVVGGDEWRERGVDVRLDEQRHKITVGSTHGRARQTAVRQSGPIDWGTTEPFTDDDFM